MTEPYDRELPILAELERQIERAAERRLAPPAPAPAAPARDTWRRPRRAAILVALTCLVSATATATVISTRSGTAARSADVTIANVPGRDGYAFTMHALGSRLCTAFILHDSLDTICEPPPRGPGEALVRSASGPFVRYVFGLTEGVAVEVRVGEERRRVNTSVLPRALTARVAPARGMRVFVVSFTRAREDPVAVVRVRARAGGGFSRPILDCSLGQIDRRC